MRKQPGRPGFTPALSTPELPSAPGGGGVGEQSTSHEEARAVGGSAPVSSSTGRGISLGPGLLGSPLCNHLLAGLG